MKNTISYDPTVSGETYMSREKQLVLERGCFSPEENLDIFNRGYKTPRHQLFLRIAEELDLKNKVVADAGCGYGAALHYCHPDSYGIDMNERAITFCRALGLN